MRNVVQLPGIVFWNTLVVEYLQVENTRNIFESIVPRLFQGCTIKAASFLLNAPQISPQSTSVNKDIQLFSNKMPIVNVQEFLNKFHCLRRFSGPNVRPKVDRVPPAELFSLLADHL